MTAPKRKRFQSPYSFWESVGWLWRNIRLKKKNPGAVQFLPKKTCLNEIKPKYRLAFIGDIMDLGHKYMEISPPLKDFIQDTDFLIGNFEATITNAKPRGMDQVHDEKVVEGLKQLYQPSKTFLSVANNHAGDFGKEIFEDSLQILIDTGFNLFGNADSPTIDPTPNIHLVAGTQWSNRPCDYIFMLEDIGKSHLKHDAMNILYPHWGYDLELYPRLPTIERAENYLLDFNAIVGHHSHAPQPITSVSPNGGLNKLCAYSLGDFCYGKLLMKVIYNYNHGLVLKMEIGTTTEGKWATGNIEWSFTESIKKDPETMFIELKETHPHFTDIG